MRIYWDFCTGSPRAAGWMRLHKLSWLKRELLAWGKETRTVCVLEVRTRDYMHAKEGT